MESFTFIFESPQNKHPRGASRVSHHAAESNPKGDYSLETSGCKFLIPCILGQDNYFLRIGGWNNGGAPCVPQPGSVSVTNGELPPYQRSQRAIARKAFFGNEATDG